MSLDETNSVGDLEINSSSLRSVSKDNSSEIFFLPKREIISNTQDGKENEHDILDIELGKQ